MTTKTDQSARIAAANKKWLAQNRGRRLPPLNAKTPARPAKPRSSRTLTIEQCAKATICAHRIKDMQRVYYSEHLDLALEYLRQITESMSTAHYNRILRAVERQILYAFGTRKGKS